MMRVRLRTQEKRGLRITLVIALTVVLVVSMMLQPASAHGQIWEGQVTFRWLAGGAHQQPDWFIYNEQCQDRPDGYWASLFDASAYRNHTATATLVGWDGSFAVLRVWVGEAACGNYMASMISVGQVRAGQPLTFVVPSGATTIGVTANEGAFVANAQWKIRACHPVPPAVTC